MAILCLYFNAEVEFDSFLHGKFPNVMLSFVHDYGLALHLVNLSVLGSLVVLWCFVNNGIGNVNNVNSYSCV